MRTSMLAIACTIAFAFTIGSVSAADQTTHKQFNTLNGVKAVLMASAELNAVKGMDHHFSVITPGQNGLIDPPASANAAPLAAPQPGRFGTDWHNEETNGVPGGSNDGSVAPSYLGLSKACGNNVIIMPSFVAC